MKTFSTLHILLLLMLMLVYQCAGAQDLVITVKGDTLKGKTKLMDYAEVPKVQLTTQGSKTVLTMYQVREVHQDSTVFRPQKGPLGYSFMKVLKEGYLSLYGFKPQSQHQYDGLLLIKKDGSFLEVPNITFKKAMSNFLEDCYDVSKNIENGSLGKKDLRQIIDLYNSCIDKKSVVENITPESARPADSVPVAATESDLLQRWAAFEKKVETHSEFNGKSDAVEMITDVRRRLSRGDKVPNFLIQGLKNSIQESDLTEELNSLLSEIQKL